jgi:hypothetical protein
MKLMILNGSTAGTVVTVVDGSKPGVEELGAQAMTTVEGDCTVVVVGDKPNLAEQLEQARADASALLRKIVTKLRMRASMRAPQDDPGSLLVAGPVLYLSLANNGTLPIRVILGDGVTDDELPALGTMKVECVGYVELRELGHVQQSDDPAQQPGGAIA